MASPLWETVLSWGLTIIGLVGNCFVILLIVFNKRLFKHFTNWFLFSLSFADLAVIGRPRDRYALLLLLHGDRFRISPDFDISPSNVTYDQHRQKTRSWDSVRFPPITAQSSWSTKWQHSFQTAQKKTEIGRFDVYSVRRVILCPLLFMATFCDFLPHFQGL